MNDTEFYKILLIHNNNALVELVSNQFRKNIDKLTICEDSSKGLKLALQIKPHLIIIDVDSQPLSSFELAANIRQTPSLKDIPIVFTYSNKNKNIPVLAFTLGATAFLNTEKDLSLLVQESKLLMDVYQFKLLAQKVYQNDKTDT
jgi:CheY-like chemotaxis protein